ncbi:MAG TPA: hypothetical protein VLL54_10600 [Pyrinomonadaceae bacterium]|nr:hypothetical protein [Pyrinomonadaceae bacterium]
MSSKLFQILAVFIFVTVLAWPASAQKACFTSEAREQAERTAKVYQEPDSDYDPVLGYSTSKGARAGAPAIDDSGRALPIVCQANKKANEGSGTTPKFYCSVAGVVDADGDAVRYKIKPHFKGQSPEKRNGEVYGEFLSSRFSKALGFFADDEWVANVTCADCEKSLNKPFQGTPYAAFQPAAGIELPLGNGIDENCDGKDAAPLAASLEKLLKSGTPRAEIDAFKLWLAFIDHGDTKTDNHKFSCLDSEKTGNSRICKPGQAVFYVSDMGSTFGFSSASENKARLATWKKKEPLKIENGRCEANAKSVGDTKISEAGRALLAGNLQKLLDAEASNELITRVFRASRNEERDQPAEAWSAEFQRKAKTIINARCSN